MTPKMSGLRIAVCLLLASIACLVYAGTAAALDGSQPVVPGVTVGASDQLAAAAVSGSLSVQVSASPSPTVKVNVGAAGAGASVSARVTRTSASVNAAAGGSAVLPAAAADASRGTRPARAHNRATGHPHPSAVRTREAARRASARDYQLSKRVEKPAKRLAPHPAKRASTAAVGPLILAEGSHLPGSAGAGLGGGSGLAVSAILVAFLFLAAPRYGRRLRPTAELARPPALLSVLERPG